MAKKTVSEVAKELGIERKDLVAYLEKQGKTKSRQDDAHRRESSGQGRSRASGREPQVRIGEERVIADNVLSESGGRRVSASPSCARQAR